LQADSAATRAIVVLLEDDEDAASVARMLNDLASDGGRTIACIPPVRGVGFFADTAAQRRLDAWWELQIPRDAQLIFVLRDSDGLAEWLVGLDGDCYVGATSTAGISGYPHQQDVRVFRARSPLDYAAAVMGDLVAVGAYDTVEAERIRSLAASYDAETASVAGSLNGGGGPADEPGPDPFDLLIAMSLGQADAAAAGMSRAPSAANAMQANENHGFRLPAWARRIGSRRLPNDISDDELANLLVMRGSTIVAVGSRKGGVGKTSHAAGVAIVAGAALDAVGRCAAIVDANLANPDAWGQLNLPPGAATVRDMIVALTTGRELPRPVHASTPALACFPEARETTEYSRTEIGLLTAHLRSRYPLVVVDLSNRLPDPTGGPAATAAAYWLEHADVLVLPSAASKQDFNGVLDYLDVRDLPPVIVASLVPRARRNREHPLTKRYMTAIAQRVYRVVDIPDDAERVRYAGMQGIPVEAVSSSLRAAYRELAEAIVHAPEAVAR
jgi:MinD-like ATPase involved in chromosome partitioning or flagellar assembly